MEQAMHQKTEFCLRYRLTILFLLVSMGCKNTDFSSYQNHRTKESIKTEKSELSEPNSKPDSEPISEPEPATYDDILANGLHVDVDAFLGSKRKEHVHDFVGKTGIPEVHYHGLGENPFGDLKIERSVDKNIIFHIKIVNGQLNKKVKLKINKGTYNWDNQPPQTTFSLSNSGAQEILKNLSVYFLKGLYDQDDGIKCTNTKAVKADHVNREGSFRVQLLDHQSGSLLWEGVVFWHNC